MACQACRLTFRVRYSETDQLGTFYNSRVLEWFELGRSEMMRDWGVPYAEMEHRGAFLPLIEAHVVYRGRASYDDLLVMSTLAERAGKASLRFSYEIVHAEAEAAKGGQKGGGVATGWTVHAITDGGGRPIRCPTWLGEILDQHATQTEGTQ
ncbi:MAG: acyl-CoA thioesterase [Phycisphaerales bacterium]|nr:acyl-CoA thioesterase [Phycisphaerales bacterium]